MDGVGSFRACRVALHAILYRMPVECLGIPLSSIFSFQGFGSSCGLCGEFALLLSCCCSTVVFGSRIGDLGVFSILVGVEGDDS